MNMGEHWPAPFDTDVEARHGLGIELVDGIARLARVDWRAQGLEGFGKPDGFHDRQVDRWLAHLTAFEFRDIPGLDEAAEWLRDHKPSQWEPGIIHGDYQFANVMFRHGAPARLAAMVDWEMSTVGDPLLDLGWVMNGWTDPGEDRTRGYVDRPACPAGPRSSTTTPGQRPGGDRDRLLRHPGPVQAGHRLEAGYARVVAGEADNPAMAAYEHVVLDTMAAAAELAASTTPSGGEGPVKVGISLGRLNPSRWAEATMVADRLGYESVWMPEHLVIPVQMAGSPYAGSDHPPIPSDVPVFDVFSLPGLPGRPDRADPLRHPGVQHRPAPSLRRGPGRDHPRRGLGGPGRVRHRGQLARGRVGGGRPRLRHPGPPGGRVHRGLPAAVERGGGRAPRGVLRLRPGDVRAQARPAPLAPACTSGATGRPPCAGRRCSATAGSR